MQLLLIIFISIIRMTFPKWRPHALVAVHESVTLLRSLVRIQSKVLLSHNRRELPSSDQSRYVSREKKINGKHISLTITAAARLKYKVGPLRRAGGGSSFLSSK